MTILRTITLLMFYYQLFITIGKTKLIKINTTGSMGKAGLILEYVILF
ncbi:hypothetical protein MP478_05755 [Chryseobacterium sp. WG14]|nr:MULTISPECIES: hypothetical protein [unclassified Chryseobacterium]MCQ9637567.1 hypothetical protein [Chryseobacterium sp. WG23]MCQ9638890.1 hypothetical protein [Chryseobacterium sp. WG14]CAH0284841.1 hypothetical protein SRABI04_04162 [Chryseobacterium sp. Bi04]